MVNTKWTPEEEKDLFTWAKNKTAGGRMPHKGWHLIAKHLNKKYHLGRTPNACFCRWDKRPKLWEQEPVKRFVIGVDPGMLQKTSLSLADFAEAAKAALAIRNGAGPAFKALSAIAGRCDTTPGAVLDSFIDNGVVSVE